MALPSFFELALLTTERTEAKRAFKLWSFIAAMNAAMARNIALDIGPNLRLFANQYIFLMGPAGCRKSSAIDDAEWLLRQKICEKIQLAPDIITKESFMKLFLSLQKILPEGTYDVRLGKVRAAVTLVNDEIVTFLGRYQNDTLLDWLTKFYDTHKPSWSYSTVLRGQETVAGTCLNILGGITPSSFADAMPPWALSSGWSRRLLIVYENAPSKLISISDAVNIELYNQRREQLAVYLASVTDVEGILEKTRGFCRLFDEIRAANQDTVASHGHLFNERLEGYYSGRPTLIAKTAMSMSMADSLELEITEGHLQTAYEEFLLVEHGMEKAYDKIGRNPLRATEATIIECLFKNGTVFEPELLSLVHADVTNKEALSAIGDLLALKKIVKEVTKGQGVRYRLKDRKR